MERPIFYLLDELLIYNNICPLCQKEINIYASCFLNKRWTTIALIKENNILKSKNEKYNIKIDINTNEIISGRENIHSINNMYESEFFRKCKTCKYYIFFDPLVYNESITKCFPAFTCYSISVEYTLHENYEITYRDDFYEPSFYIKEMGMIKKIKTPHIDLSKIKNKKQLQNKIKTLLTFY